MNESNLRTTAPQRQLWLRVAGVVGMLFGLMTLREGGAVLFVDGAAREAAGNYVPFVLWFNFLAGFVYVIAGLGLWFLQTWSARVALGIGVATLVVFAAFGLHAIVGGAFETRTVVAMTLRSTIWLLIAAIAWRSLVRKTPGPPMEPGLK
ncbi:MAG: hypothetical protein U5K38_03145 [Woeseiaceae bacterium]|nr:hypothetical protein [Woeseiaceae bacterium]